MCRKGGVGQRDGKITGKSLIAFTGRGSVLVPRRQQRPSSSEMLHIPRYCKEYVYWHRWSILRCHWVISTAHCPGGSTVLILLGFQHKPTPLIITPPDAGWSFMLAGSGYALAWSVFHSIIQSSLIITLHYSLIWTFKQSHSLQVSAISCLHWVHNYDLI